MKLLKKVKANVYCVLDRETGLLTGIKVRILYFPGLGTLQVAA